MRGRSGVLAALLLAVGAVALGWVAPPEPVTASVTAQLLALARVLLAVVTTVALVLGPGLVLRGRRHHDRVLRLGFVPLPGIVLLALVGLLVWALADRVDGAVVARIGTLLLLVLVLVGAWVSPTPVTLEEGRVLLVAAGVLAVALARSLWSLGPAGELYAGTISRTLEVGDRPDSRISYHVVSVITHGFGPTSPQAQALFSPYSFGDRGPVPGLVTSPLTLALGTRPTVGIPDQVWSTFDPQGFMVYRITMIVLAVCALLAVHTVARQAFGARVAWLSVLVAAGTPFVVHEVYFTWPKLAAAGACLLAATVVLQRRALGAGLLVGLGYLMHPLALLSVPVLGLLVLLVAWRRDAVVASVRTALARGLGLGLSLGVVLVAWRLANGSDYQPAPFFHYFQEADGVLASGPADWFSARGRSLLNTFVPFRLPLAEADNPSINTVYGGRSDTTVHVFFQYWTGLALGVSLLFYPVLLLGLARVLRSRPVVVLALVVVPLLFFVVYWGSFASGLMREGLHPWVLTVLVLWASQYGTRPDAALGLPGWLRGLLALRLVEVLAMLTVPTVHATGALTGSDHRAGDVAALALGALGLGLLGWLTLQGTSRRWLDRVDEVPPAARPMGHRALRPGTL